MSDAPNMGLPTPATVSPLRAFALDPRLSDPIPLAPSQPGHCELCHLPLDPGEVKFHRTHHGFDCKAAFYALARQEGPFLLPRLILIRRTRPHRKGEAIPGIAKEARRDLDRHIDDLIRRMRDAGQRQAGTVRK